MQYKLSKSDQTKPSLSNLSEEVIAKAKIAEENYLRVREELRLKYQIKE